MPRPTGGFLFVLSVALVALLVSAVTGSWVLFWLVAAGAFAYAWWFPTFSDDVRLKRNRQ